MHVRERAPAKLTRSLRVRGVRPDGYHLLEAEMVSLDLHDTLEFSPGDGLEVVWECEQQELDAGGGNLVERALRLLGRQAMVKLTKRVPAGAGLGGGSSDAAAVLRWAGVRCDQAGLSMAASIGADVPFCLVGGRAVVAGKGELVTPLPFVGLRVVLLTPPLEVSTALVYRRWDEMGGPSSNGPNDLEPAALDLEPGLEPWRELLAKITGKTPTLAGSGSSWFVELEETDTVPVPLSSERRRASVQGPYGQDASIVLAETTPALLPTCLPPGAASASPSASSCASSYACAYGAF